MVFNTERADDISNYAGGFALSNCRTPADSVDGCHARSNQWSICLVFPGRSSIDESNAVEMLTPSEDSSRRSVRDSVPSVLGWKCTAALEHWMRNQCDILVASR